MNNFNFESACGEFILVPANGTNLRTSVFTRLTPLSESDKRLLNNILLKSKTFTNISRLSDHYENREGSERLLTEYFKSVRELNPHSEIYIKKSGYTMPIIKSVHQTLIRSFSSGK
ncbi:conserved hypothetical protein [Vibrio chagasii]|nr:hypothetical protein AOG25_08585 [Vibrio alginolyticus]CAH7144902.1 conserved hypothetical protein [Vibrio chagasii]CAH7235803.1 conserved hypothetical protein [Vibrio chagasii]